MPTASNEREPGEKELEEDDPAANESATKKEATHGTCIAWA